MYFAKNPVRAVREAMAASKFIKNRPRTRFRELNEIRNKVQIEGIREKLSPFLMWGMLRAQLIADVISFRAGYEKAIANDPTISKEDAVAIAEQVVRDSQGGGEIVDQSRLERGSMLTKLFTTFFNFQNTGTNLAYLSANTNRSLVKRAFDMLLIFTVPVLVNYLAKDILRPGGEEDDEDLAKKLLVDQLTYLTGSIAFVRELTPAIENLFGEGWGGYKGPTGLKPFVDAARFTEQAGQGEADDAFRKATVDLLGDVFGLPSVAINRFISGYGALSEGDTENPFALVFGYKKPK